MRTLYVSDLDGTLLRSDIEISSYTAAILNRCYEKGICFTAATARTVHSVKHILSGIRLWYPVILTNGACVLDMESGEFMHAAFIGREALGALCHALHRHETAGCLHTLHKVYHEKPGSEYTRAYMEERARKYGKLFIQVQSFEQLSTEQFIHFSVTDTYERLLPLYEELRVIDTLRIEFYRDTYNTSAWYLEALSHLASKRNAVRWLQEQYGFERTVAFGDNLNDLPMFEASDECYAVENAKPEVKAAATAVIRGNDRDGVAHWLEENVLLGGCAE